MGLINPATIESIRASETKKISEKGRTGKPGTPQGSTRTQSTPPGNIASTAGRLSILQNRLENSIANAFEESSGDIENSIDYTLTYRQSEIDFTPEATAERVVSKALSHYKDLRNEIPEFNEAEAIQEFVKRIRQAINEGFREYIDILGDMKVLDREKGREIEITNAVIRKGINQLEHDISPQAEPVVVAAEPQDKS